MSTFKQPPRDFTRLDRFLDRIAGEIYPEPPSPIHNEITQAVIEGLSRDGTLKPGDKVLDVGCGKGIALEHFRNLGATAIGITLGPDAAICRAKGFDVREIDQNFMEFDDGAFDLLWCRHVLEHSVAPLFTLSEYRRVTKPDSCVYVEVPAPDTSARHEENPNHYSVLPSSAWVSLFRRSGFTIERATGQNLTLDCGPDVYWSFLLRVPR